MYRRFGSWQDIRDLDQPGAFRNECKLLIDQILKFTYSEAPIYGRASEEEVEKQDVSYRLLEEENFFLKSQVVSLEKVILARVDEIASLKKIIGQLKCRGHENNDCVELEEVSLPDVEKIIKRINSAVENILDENIMIASNHAPIKKTTVMNSVDSSVESDIDILTSSSANPSSSSHQSSTYDILELTESRSNAAITFQKSKENEIETLPESSRGEGDMPSSIEDKYDALKRENLALEDKIKILTEKITLLKSSLNSCEIELGEYDNMMTIIKTERYNLIAELRQTKQDYNALGLRNEYLQRRVEELENQLKREPAQPESSPEDLLNCYKSRLYVAFKEMSMKEEQIGKLNDSFDGLVEKFKIEKSSLEVKYTDRLKEYEGSCKLLCDEKVKLEETVRQQSKLIDHLQALVERKERKSASKIHCLKDS